MSSDVEISTTAPTSRLRRVFASSIAWCVFLTLFVVWGSAPPLLLLNNVRDGVDATLWIGFGLSFLSYLACLVSVPQSYYDLRPFEMDGHFYRRLGVRKFRYIVGDGDGIQRLQKRIDPHWQCSLTKLSNEKWTERTCGTELIKLALICFTLPIVAIGYYRGHTALASLFLLSNIPFNIYPILLQRYTRAKLLRIAQLRNNRAASKNDLVSASTV